MLLHIDNLALMMIFLILFVGANVSLFSFRFLQGNVKFKPFFVYLGLLILSLISMVSSDHIVLFLLFWMASNLLLAKLMFHKENWTAARKSALLALKSLMLGTFFMSIAFALFYIEYGTVSIKEINAGSIQSSKMAMAVVFLVLAAMCQSAIWPFHRWLLSSLNSPTPVSAIMHAGLVNGGGFLLVRFAPLLIQSKIVIGVIFVIGIFTAIFGTLWKLMQHDIKRTLACSTMGQMGFMFVQIGLGLFPAAVAHICLHGLYKSFLFFKSGSVVEEKRYDLSVKFDSIRFFLSVCCGLVGGGLFAYIAAINVIDFDTSIVPWLVSVLVCVQLSLTIMRDKNHKYSHFFLALVVSAFVSAYYALILTGFESLLGENHHYATQPLNFYHLSGLSLLVLTWGGLLLARYKQIFRSPSKWLMRFYVKALNASQPSPETVTAVRNHYQYL